MHASVLQRFLPAHRPVLALAPMQDVTDLRFWNVLAHYGSPDVLYTEYFRVHPDSHPEKPILADIDANATGRPVIAQMIGRDIPSLVRTAAVLQRHPIVAVDLNLGCPAPVVCRKDAGGGLLRDLPHIDAILRALRGAIGAPCGDGSGAAIGFTVKTRIGYDSAADFPRLLDIFASHQLDALTVHGRSVREMYGPVVHYDLIGAAARRMQAPGAGTPVLANGNVRCTTTAQAITADTGVRGLMIGRGAIRNPWIFRQIREHYELPAGAPRFRPTMADVRGYIDVLARETRREGTSERAHLGHLKKLLNYIAPGLGGDDAFVRNLRKASTLAELFAACDAYLLAPERADADAYATEPNWAASLNATQAAY
ncbi:dihydrouridine synthase [Verrucomicrobia bacterium LW23]|nr:dihydrouridine synthase [Verrucomicrobia bacterium LW23]